MEMCDSSQLQIDLFVTNDTPRQSRRRPSAQPLGAFDSTDELAPPTAPFARQGRSGSPSRDSLASEGSDWSDAEESPSHSRQFKTMSGYGEHVDSVTDLVLFEGEEAERTPAEVEVSAKLKKEGKLRRALSRRGGKDVTAPSAPLRHTNHSTQRLYESPQAPDSFEALPLDHHDSSPSLHNDSPYAPRSASFGDIGHGHQSPSMHFDDHSEVQTLGDNSSTRHFFGGRSRQNSAGDLAGSHANDSNQGFFLDVTEAEQQDLDVVAELARPGYPRLEQILDDEVQRSAGKTMVACEFRHPLAPFSKRPGDMASGLRSRSSRQLDRGNRQSREARYRRQYRSTRDHAVASLAGVSRGARHVLPFIASGR